MTQPDLECRDGETQWLRTVLNGVTLLALWAILGYPASSESAERTEHVDTL
jgi:hypothetical protein